MDYFHDMGIDLDSDRTQANISFQYHWRHKVWGTSPRAWKGVSSDDIYYSRFLGKEIYSYGLDNLRIPLFRS